MDTPQKKLLIDIAENVSKMAVDNADAWMMLYNRVHDVFVNTTTQTRLDCTNLLEKLDKSFVCETRKRIFKNVTRPARRVCECVL